MGLVSAASSTVWLKKNVTLEASQTLVVDVIPSIGFNFVHYFLRFENLTGNKAKSLNLEAQKVDGSITDLVYSKFGNTVNIEINTFENSGLFQLEIVNNETEKIVVRLARLTL